jgi:NitT/TauT family transport system permease protein
MTPARVRRALSPWLVAGGICLAWEVGCRAFAVPEFVLPTPSATAGALIEYWPAIWPNALHTLYTTVIGFLFALAVGVVIGVLVGTFPALYRALNPLLIGFNSVPKVAVVPVLVMWFGIGTVPAVISAFLISFFPIVVNVATGIATLEPELEDVLRSLGARRLDLLRHVGLPRAMPYLFASLKIAITLAFVGSVISETIASNAGVGALMLTATASFRVPLVFAGLATIAAMGMVMYALASLVEKRFTFWATRRADDQFFAGG